MITITQLLESVDLDFEPRWVTQDACGDICICDDHKPEPDDVMWDIPVEAIYDYFGKLNIVEFANKPWQECIYEVPRKTTGKIGRLEMQEIHHGGEDLVLRTEMKPATPYDMHLKINELVDAVNELKGANNE